MARRPCSITSITWCRSVSPRITTGKRDRGYWDALEIGGEVIEVDTTDFAGIDYDAICERIRAAL